MRAKQPNGTIVDVAPHSDADTTAQRHGLRVTRNPVNGMLEVPVVVKKTDVNGEDIERTLFWSALADGEYKDAWERDFPIPYALKLHAEHLHAELGDCGVLQLIKALLTSHPHPRPPGSAPHLRALLGQDTQNDLLNAFESYYTSSIRDALVAVDEQQERRAPRRGRDYIDTATDADAALDFLAEHFTRLFERIGNYHQHAALLREWLRHLLRICELTGSADAYAILCAFVCENATSMQKAALMRTLLVERNAETTSPQRPVDVDVDGDVPF